MIRETTKQQLRAMKITRPANEGGELVNITGIPVDAMETLFTCATLYLLDSAAALEARRVYPEGRDDNPQMLADYAETMEEGRDTLRYIEDVYRASSRYGKSHTEAWDYDAETAEQMRRFALERRARLEASADTPLPNYGPIVPLAEARAHTRVAIRRLGNASADISELLIGKKGGSAQKAIQALERMIYHAQEAIKRLQQYVGLPDDNATVTVKKRFPEPWEEKLVHGE